MIYHRISSLIVISIILPKKKILPKKNIILPKNSWAGVAALVQLRGFMEVSNYPARPVLGTRRTYPR